VAPPNLTPRKRGVFYFRPHAAHRPKSVHHPFHHPFGHRLFAFPPAITCR
jgi:hypothetical protein